MSNILNWIETTGGPHVLLPEELAPFWRGVEGWFDHLDPTDRSDYARACRVEDWLGLIPCHSGSALVFSGDVGPIAWVPTVTTQVGRGQAGYFVQWIGIDDEREIAPVLKSRLVQDRLASSKADMITFNTGENGRMLLLDASDDGSHLIGEHASIELVPGVYVVRANYIETPTMMMVVREIRLSENG